MKPIGLIIFALLLPVVGYSILPRVEFEITLGGSPAANSAEWDSTLAVLRRRIEKIAEGKFDFTPAGDSKYMLRLHTALTDHELEYVLTSPGRIEFWELCYWSRDLADILPWSRKLQEEEMTESNFASKIVASYISYRDSVSDPCILEEIPTEVYPAVMTVLDSLKAAGIIPGKTRFGQQAWKTFGKDVHTIYLLNSIQEPIASHSFIEKISYAAPSRKRYFPELNIVCNEEGTKFWQKFTFKNIGKYIAITFDGEILIVPQIFSAIENGKIIISTGTKMDEAKVSLLKYIPVMVGSGTLALPVGCKRK